MVSVSWGSKPEESGGYGDLDGRVNSRFEGMSVGFGPPETVDGIGGAESATTRRRTMVNSSLLCEVELSEDSGCEMGWVTGKPVEMSATASVRWAASTSSEVIERV